MRTLQSNKGTSDAQPARQHHSRALESGGTYVRNLAERDALRSRGRRHPKNRGRRLVCERKRSESRFVMHATRLWTVLSIQYLGILAWECLYYSASHRGTFFYYCLRHSLSQTVSPSMLRRCLVAVSRRRAEILPRVAGTDTAPTAVNAGSLALGSSAALSSLSTACLLAAPATARLVVGAIPPSTSLSRSLSAPTVRAPAISAGRYQEESSAVINSVAVSPPCASLGLRERCKPNVRRLASLSRAQPPCAYPCRTSRTAWRRTTST